MESAIELRLKELYQADIDGRLLVLPCRIGDSLFKIAMPTVYCGRQIQRPVPYIKQFKLTQNNLSRVIFGGEIGKTLFLSLEEAERAARSVVEDDKHAYGSGSI